MTVAVGADVGMELGREIGAGGRTGLGFGAGQSQASSVFMPGKGQSASWLSATHETFEPSVSGTGSFRSRWQAMVNTLETGPEAGPKTARGTGSGIGSETGQGTAIRTRREAGTEVEGADEQADASGEMSGVVEASLPQGSKSSAAPASPKADEVPQWMQATEEQGEPAAGTAAVMQARSQSGILEWSVAAAQVHSENAAQAAEASGNARTGHSAKSNGRYDAAQRTSAEPQATASNNGALVAIAVTGNPLAQAGEMQTQFLAANFASSSPSVLTDRVLSSDREPGSAADRVTGSAITAGNGATGTAGIAARSRINSQGANGNPVIATPDGSEDGEPAGVPLLAPEEAGPAAKQLTGLPRAMETQAEATQLAPTASHPGTGNGSPQAEAAQEPRTAEDRRAYQAANHEARQGVDGNSALASQSPPAISVADKPMVHRDSAGDGSQPAMHVVLPQLAGAGAETSGMARVPIGAEGATGAMSAHAGVPAGAAAGAEAQETFAAMDAGTRVGTPGWIHAGGQTAEAGFQDPALGWVGVRADLSGGNVHAALMPGSVEAAQTLSGHLAGLNSYLAEQHTPVATLTLAAPGGSGVESGAGQSMQQGAGQTPGQDAEQNTTQWQSSLRPGTATNPAAAARVADSGSSAFDTVAHMGEMRGRHISVIA